MTLDSGCAIAALALAIEAAVGYPDALFRRVGHPVTWFGALIAALDARLNRDADPPARRRANGALTLAILLVVALAAGVAATLFCRALPLSAPILALLASSLLAQRSLHAHVADVARALERSLDDGRAAVSKIVGRDPALLDEAGVARAAIESLAENFSDGVVAPAFWLTVGGLPAALAYKAANTADSMIGHKSPRYLAFGWAAARFDDLVNLLPARLAAVLIALAARMFGDAEMRGALRAARRDARRHLSPNAGWPEAAMAGALGLKLGGPRAYGAEAVAGAWLGDGRADATAADIRRALALYRRTAALLWTLIATLCALI
jgi:adenosylcobinamide-phosphate synthase